MWRDWFVFTKQDYRAIVLLILVLTLVLSGISFCSRKQQPVCHRTVVDSIIAQDSMYQVVRRTRRTRSTAVKQVPVHMHRFDPNRADSAELRTLGLSGFVASNIVKYRKAGGVFREPRDVARIYGLEDSTYRKIAPYIKVPPKEKEEETVAVNEGMVDMTQLQEVPHERKFREKYAPGTLVDLNHADTTELMKIPGIGPVYAAMIVNYREQLGGFYTIAQLRDLEPLPEGLGDWMFLNEEKCRPIWVNKLSVTQLRKHPYLNFYQAKAIVDLRKKVGNLSSIKQLRFLKEFSTSDLERLAPYLSFE